MEKDLVLHSSQWLATTSANILCYKLKRKAHQIKNSLIIGCYLLLGKYGGPEKGRLVFGW
jgi:hypothetical protein